MKEDQLITFETAVLAKEKKFRQINSGVYFTKDKQHCLVGWGIDNIREYSAPSQTTLQTWFRDEHNIKIYCVPAVDSTYWYSKILYNDNTGSTSKHNSYEEALEHGLKEALIKL